LVLLRAVALLVLRMRAPVFPPVVAMAFPPRPLCASLIVLVVAIALPLGLLPAAPSLTLTGRLRAVALPGNLRARPKRPAAGCAVPLHEHSPCTHCTKHAEQRPAITTSVPR